MVNRKVKKNNTNVAVAPKEPLYMPLMEQYEVIKEYTKVFKDNLESSKLKREIECYKVLYPKIFRPMYEDDLVFGRVDILPIGFGSVTSVGGPGHYCDFNKIEKFRGKVNDNELDEMISFWKEHDTREIFYKENLIEDELSRFVDVFSPAIVTARFSGMYLDYNLLLDNGLEGLKSKIKKAGSKEEHKAMVEAIELIQYCIDEIKDSLKKEIEEENNEQIKKAKIKLIDVFTNIKDKKPSTFLEAIQLSWLYSLFAGVVNYGRMDDYLGDYLVNDLNNGVIDEEEAISYIQSLWRLIEVKRTNVNGRVVVGGKGRRNPENADVFCKLSIEATRRSKLVEPQFTLRIYDDMNKDIYNQALDCIAEGVTYPIIYNDEVNVDAAMKMMHIDEKTAYQYVPFGCGEFTLSGMGIGTPNSCLNVLKILDIFIHNGEDQWDYKFKLKNFDVKKVEDIETFEEFMEEYKRVLDKYIMLSGDAHGESYRVMNREVGFIFTSILTYDCIGRGKMVLDGGVYHRGGTNEMYGNISASNSLAAIKKVVFDDKKYTMSEVKEALRKDFEGFEDIKLELENAPKYGNDIDYVDDIAIDVHEHLCLTIADYAPKIGLDSWLVVVINNQVNTEWGRATASTPDGRIAGMYMANANNPMSGDDKEGPTAMLNSLVKLRADIHGGSVQNIKFSKNMFIEERDKIKYLFKTYFKNGGPQLMITIINPGDLEKAYKNPENYKDLTVRVGGFSARFVNLEDDVQREIMARTCNE